MEGRVAATAISTLSKKGTGRRESVRCYTPARPIRWKTGPGLSGPGLRAIEHRLSPGPGLAARLFPGNRAYPPTAPAILKMGRYMETTSPPMTTPINTIITGSIAAVRFSTAWSTSSS